MRTIYWAFFALAAFCLPAGRSSGFSLDAATVVPSPVITPADEVSLLLDVRTPTLYPDLFQPTQVDRVEQRIEVEIFVTSPSPLTAIGFRQFEVQLGKFTLGQYNYHVHLTPDHPVGWGVRDVFGTFTVSSPRGDANGDGRLDATDIDLLTREVRAGTHTSTFDLDGDGLVDHDDREFWIRELKNTYFGDANLDGEFNSSDLIDVFEAGQYEDYIEGNSTWSSGDWNGDGESTTSDLVVAFQSGGYERGPRGAVSGVPEPLSVVLLGTAILTIAARLRRSE